MNNYDNYITGQYDSNSPMNQEEVTPEPTIQFINLTDVYVNGDTEEFVDFQTELIEEANILLYALESVESGLTGKLKSIIEKLK